MRGHSVGSAIDKTHIFRSLSPHFRYKRITMYSPEGYRSLLTELKNKGYQFVFYDEKDDAEQIVILRHDIDISPTHALNMAKIEHNLCLKSTYFFMTRSPFYNLFSRHNDVAIREIIDLGHHVALHFDAGYKIGSKTIQKQIDQDISYLESNFDLNIEVVSFHQPNQDVIQGKVKIQQINTYDKTFFKDILYISDSNMTLSDEKVHQMLSGDHKKVQLLIHPMWWMIDGQTTEEKFTNTMAMNFELEQAQMVSTERAYGSARVISFT